MKRIPAASIVLAIMLSGCASPDYSDRIESLESAVASQAQQIEALQEALVQPSTAINPEVTATAEPSAATTLEPVDFTQYADAGPEILYDLLPDGFVHLFPEDTVIWATLGYNQEGYEIGLLYDVNSLDQDSFDAFSASCAAADDRVDWDGDSGFISTQNVNYNIYEYYEGGVILQVFPKEEPNGAVQYLEVPLVDYDAYLLPEALILPPDDVSVTFFADSISVDTALSWSGLNQEDTEQVIEYYLEQLSGNDWYKPEDMYARLDEYRAIRIVTMQEEDGYTLTVKVFNFTINQYSEE